MYKNNCFPYQKGLAYQNRNNKKINKEVKLRLISVKIHNHRNLSI